jgi:hypothetical protein
MYWKSIELENQLYRDRQLEQAEKYRLIKMARASRPGSQKPVFANIREKLTSLDLWLKAGRAALQVS